MRAKTNENYCHWGSITPDFSCLTVIKLIICICWTSFQCVRIKWFVFCRENGRFFATTAPDFTEISRVEALQLTRKLRALNSMCELNAIQCYKAVQFSIAIHLFRTWLTIETNRWNDRFNRILFFEAQARIFFRVPLFLLVGMQRFLSTIFSPRINEYF